MIRQHYWLLGSKEESGRKEKTMSKRRRKGKTRLQATEKCEIRGSVVRRRPRFGSQYPTVTHNSLFILFKGISYLFYPSWALGTHMVHLYIFRQK